MAWSKTSRQSRGYGKQWDRLRIETLEQDGYLCRMCKAKGLLTPATDVDHITPKAKGGTDDASNRQSLCKPCHKAKTITENGGTPRLSVGFDSSGLPIDPAHHWNV